MCCCTADIKKKTCAAFFPLHNYSDRAALCDEWLNCRGRAILPWNQPFDKIKNYLGEKMCLHFYFLSHLSYWLCMPAFVGIPVQIIRWYGAADGDSLHGGTRIGVVAFAFFISLWGITMLEYWKRFENTVALHWGMVGFEDLERDQPGKSNILYSYS